MPFLYRNAFGSRKGTSSPVLPYSYFLPAAATTVSLSTGLNPIPDHVPPAVFFCPPLLGYQLRFPPDWCPLFLVSRAILSDSFFFSCRFDLEAPVLPSFLRPRPFVAPFHSPALLGFLLDHIDGPPTRNSRPGPPPSDPDCRDELPNGSGAISAFSMDRPFLMR